MAHFREFYIGRGWCFLRVDFQNRLPFLDYVLVEVATALVFLINGYHKWQVIGMYLLKKK